MLGTAAVPAPGAALVEAPGALGVDALGVDALGIDAVGEPPAGSWAVAEDVVSVGVCTDVGSGEVLADGVALTPVPAPVGDVPCGAAEVVPPTVSARTGARSPVAPTSRDIA